MARLTLVESEVQQLKVELDDVQAKLKNSSIELGKTQARNKTMEKHEQVTRFFYNFLIAYFSTGIMLRRLTVPLCYARNCTG